MGDKDDLILALRSQMFEYCAKLYVGVPWGTWNWLHKKRFLLRKRLTIIVFFEVIWSVGVGFRRYCQFEVQNKKMAMSPSSTVHGGRYETKYVTFEYLLHAAFVADTILGCLP